MNLCEIFLGVELLGHRKCIYSICLSGSSTRRLFLYENFLLCWNLIGGWISCGNSESGKVVCLIIQIHFRSVAQSCPTLWDPMDCSTPGFPVYHQLPKLAQTHVHWVGDATNHLILCHLLFLLPSIFPSIGVFSNESVLPIRWPKYWSFSFSISPSNEWIQDWFPLGLTSLISFLSKGLSRVFSNTKFKSINSLASSFLYGPTLTSIHDHRKNHSHD